MPSAAEKINLDDKRSSHDDPIVHFPHPTDDNKTLCGAPKRGITAKSVSCVVCLDLRKNQAA